MDVLTVTSHKAVGFEPTIPASQYYHFIYNLEALYSDA